RSARVHGFLTWCVTTVIVMAFVALAAGSSATLMSNLGGPAAAVAGQVEIAQRGLAGEAPRLTPEARGRVDSMRRALGHLSLASFFALLLGGVAGVLGGNAAYETFRPDRPQPRVTWSIPPGWLPRRSPTAGP